MNQTRRYRWKAVECLLAAKNCDLHYRNLTLAIAASWHALARQDEAIDELLASWSMTAPAHETGAIAVSRQGA
jgi:hypothetical protein